MSVRPKQRPKEDFGAIARRCHPDPHGRGRARLALVYHDFDEAVKLAARGDLTAMKKIGAAISGLDAAREDMRAVAHRIAAAYRD